MVPTRSPTSKSSRPFNNPLVTVLKAPITIGIIVTFMFHSFFQFSSKVEVLILLFSFFQFYSMVSRDSKVDNFANSLLFINYYYYYYHYYYYSMLIVTVYRKISNSIYLTIDIFSLFLSVCFSSLWDFLSFCTSVLLQAVLLDKNYSFCYLVFP